MTQPGSVFFLEVTAKVPPRLARLEELAKDLWYSWDQPTRGLFGRLDPELWEAVGHSPRALLNQIDEQRLAAAAEDPGFLGHYNRVLSAYDSYLGKLPRQANGNWLAEGDLVAYFCAEFGFHESLPIYSGGLGILAGDHCKAASDTRLPFLGVGLLYRQGYFFQTIDGDGNQLATYHDSDFRDLPIAPARDSDDGELHVTVEMAGRTVQVKVWEARVGHVRLVLLDTDLDPNSEHDRSITHQLYGGDRTTRIEQEIVLGVGGVRALAALGLRPTVWHINEGHAAFLILERTRANMARGHDFATALEAVASNTVFTTHTAVPAGHDHFSADMMLHHFEGFCREAGLDPQALLALGRTGASSDFNMTALALRGSRRHNGVSRIHGGVSARMLRDLWPQVPAEENPIDYVTNGVHVPTFLAPEWGDIFERFIGADWGQRLTDREYWARVHAIPDHIFWSMRQHLKSQMLRQVHRRVSRQLIRNRASESHLDRLFRLADPDNPNVLTIAFGRRFATYKRAALIFEDIDLLKQIVGNPERPVVFIFAGKAHPADRPGQDLIRHIMQIAKLPDFEGKILLVENYDLRLARRLVSGADVWLNHPIYPMEASGTSGMKAAMNGVLNLSVLDGWWDEGCLGNNGWGIKPAGEHLDQAKRNREEARALYEVLQDHVVPLYYARGDMGYPAGWLRMAKQAIATLLPRFSATRMLSEYAVKFYRPAADMGRRYHADELAVAREVAGWKARVLAAWPGVSLRVVSLPQQGIWFGERVRMEVALQLNGLQPGDVAVELLLEQGPRGSSRHEVQKLRFSPMDASPTGAEQLYVLDLAPEHCGKMDYRLRAFPTHPQLTHPLELGQMIWA